jgi:hypothetical protein
VKDLIKEIEEQKFKDDFNKDVTTYVYCANCGRKIVVDNSEEIKKYPFKEGDVETRSKKIK